MYDYSEKSNPLGTELLPFVDDVLDNIPIKHPYVPRLCKQQGHMLIWYGTEDTDPDITGECFKAKDEPQWITCKEDWKVEKAVALIWPYENEVIIGAVKYPGYMRIRSSSEIRRHLKSVWKDIITMFGDRKLICPTGTYLTCIHAYMNHSLIPLESYHYRLMKSNGFTKVTNEYWVREPT